MMLGNMRALGVQRLITSCLNEACRPPLSYQEVGWRTISSSYCQPFGVGHRHEYRHRARSHG